MVNENDIHSKLFDIALGSLLNTSAVPEDQIKKEKKDFIVAGGVKLIYDNRGLQEMKEDNK